MSLPALDRLQAAHPACDTLAFADLSAAMVLVSTGDDPREMLDALCAEAMLIFGSDSAPALGQDAPDHVIIASAGQLRLHLRGLDDPYDALSCCCGPDLNLPAFLQDARRTLEEIANGG
jgi:hypothetical protein